MKVNSMTKITFDDFYQSQHSTHPTLRLRHIISETHHGRFSELKSIPEFNPDLLVLALWMASVYECYDLLMEICDQAVHMPPSVAVAYIEVRLVSFVVNRVGGIVNSVEQAMECDTTAAQETGKFERFGDIPRD
jgi:hypothetical protein